MSINFQRATEDLVKQIRANNDPDSISTVENISESITPGLMLRIVNNLVLIEHIVQDRHVYGGIQELEKKLIKEAVQAGIENNIVEEDVYQSLVEYFRQSLAEIGPIMPVTGMTTANSKPPAQAAAAGTQTDRPVTPAQPAANIAMQLKSVNPQELEKNIGTMLQKDPNLSKDINKSFASVLATMIKNKV